MVVMAPIAGPIDRFAMRHHRFHADDQIGVSWPPKSVQAACVRTDNRLCPG